MFLFPAGLYFCFSKLDDGRIFIILYAASALYFSGVMVRLMLVLAPVMCIVSGIGVSNLLSTYMKEIVATDRAASAAGGHERKKSKFEGNYFYRSEVSVWGLAWCGCEKN